MGSGGVARVASRLACAGGFALGLACGPGAPPPPPARLPNVLLVTLDTTRADHLSVYGYERETSPNLAELARESRVFERAHATSSWTMPSHASLFTGRYPSSHGAHHDPEGALVLADEIRAPEGVRSSPIAPGQTTLAMVLAQAGHRTGGVVGGPWLLAAFGLAEGFSYWNDDGITDPGGRPATAITDAALDWLDADGDEPFFLFLNYFDPHFPYWPPRGHRAAFLAPGVTPNPRAAVQSEALYDAEILYMDGELGRVLRHLRERGLYEDTLIVVTADHGEMFGEHDYHGHENFLWEPLVHVPLIVKPPGPHPQPVRETQPVAGVDVMPLVLDALGLSWPDAVQGRVPGPERPVLAEVNPIAPRSGLSSWRALWRGRHKLLAGSRGERQLFDLETDPGELDDLAPERPDELRALERELAAAFDALPLPPRDDREIHVDRATREALRAMGYLEGQGAPAPENADPETR